MNIKRIVNLKGLGSKTGIASLALLALIGIGMICPMVGEEASADSHDSINTIANVDVAPVLSIAADTKVDLDITPKSTGAFSSDDINLVISTNSRNGYSLYMSTLDGNGALKNNNDSIADQINPVTPDTKSDGFTANTWGYSLDEGDDKTYQPVPITNQAIDYVTSSSTENVRTLTFGAKVDTSLAAGQYSTVVAISAVANPITLSTLHDLTYMQQMTSEICNNTISADMKNPATKQLIDTRDGKSYWVAKLADGNCWMTQNLALDITDAGLSAADTDIREDWNQNSTYPPTKTRTTMLSNDESMTNTDSYSFNLGTWVLATPSLPVTCSAASVDLKDSCYRNSGIIVNIANRNKFQPGYVAKVGTWIYPDGTVSEETLVAVKCTEWQDGICVAGTYDEHYLLGNC